MQKTMPAKLPVAEPSHMTNMTPDDNSSNPERSDMEGMVPSMKTLKTAVTTGIDDLQSEVLST